MRRPFRDAAVVVVGLAVWACTRGEPPAPSLDAAVASLPPPNDHTAGDASALLPVASAASAAPTTTAAPVDDQKIDPGTLPQTHDKPSKTSAGFVERMGALFRAVVKDDPSFALSAFFPIAAYEQVKAIANPASDWKHRLVSAYERDIHALHTSLGESAARAKFIRVEVPEARARWVEPNEETNKIGYYRVYGARVVYDVDGVERSFDVSSLISWRGEWYVVHLTGFR